MEDIAAVTPVTPNPDVECRVAASWGTERCGVTLEKPGLLFPHTEALSIFVDSASFLRGQRSPAVLSAVNRYVIVVLTRILLVHPIPCIYYLEVGPSDLKVTAQTYIYVPDSG